MNWLWIGMVAGLALLALAVGESEVEEALWEPKPLTPENGFTEGIEGPASDRQGNVYAVNYARQGTIGRTTPAGASVVWVELPRALAGRRGQTAEAKT